MTHKGISKAGKLFCLVLQEWIQDFKYLSKPIELYSTKHNVNEFIQGLNDECAPQTYLKFHLREFK